MSNHCQAMTCTYPLRLFFCKSCCYVQHVDSGGGGETHKNWTLFWPWGDSLVPPRIWQDFWCLGSIFPSNRYLSIHPSIFLSIWFVFLFSNFPSFSLLCFSCLGVLACLVTFLIQSYPTPKVYICEQHLHMYKESHFQALVLAGVEPEVLKYKHFQLSHSLDNRWPNLCSKIVFNSVWPNI